MNAQFVQCFLIFIYFLLSLQDNPQLPVQLSSKVYAKGEMILPLNSVSTLPLAF